MNNKKDQMHPDDMRNLLIFMLISVILWFAYDVYILDPQKEALRQAEQMQAEQSTTTVHVDNVTIEEEPLERTEALANGGRIKIDNGMIFGSISLVGARIDDISLYEYFKTLDKKENVELLSPKATTLPRYIEYGWISADNTVPVPESNTKWSVQGNKVLNTDSPVTLIWNNGQGIIFKRTISLDENYVFKITQNVTNKSGEKITLHPYGLIAQKGVPQNFQGRFILHEGPIGFIGDELHEVSYKKLRKEGEQKYTSSQGWTGLTDKYWLTSLIPPQGKNINYSYGISGGSKARNSGERYQIDFVGKAVSLNSGESADRNSHLFTGPKKVLMLEEYKEKLGAPKFDLAVNFGWFWFLAKPFFYILHFLGLKIGNMGFAIILLTLIIRSAVFPLTNASYKSFGKMKKISPQVAALREKHGNDKQALQKELVEVYQKEGVNPMAGCLPIILQIPIFFALYKSLFVTIEIRHAPFIGWIHDLSAPDPTSVFNLFGLIPWSPPGFLMIGVWPCAMLIAMVIQKKLNPPPQDPIQRDMANYFPFMMCFILSKFASGLVIYWACSAWIGVIQQMIIMRKMGVPIHLFGETEEEKELDEAIDKGPAVHPLIEMAEDEVEDALFGDEEEEEEEEKIKEISKPKPKKKTKAKKKKTSSKKRT
ncbi:MAG: membrane protein insertase YidC [Alphaproteobacteria bacterium]|nr:membrane protein insertase YidC [Alphaproteobacteria bacterium]